MRINGIFALIIAVFAAAFALSACDETKRPDAETVLPAQINVEDKAAMTLRIDGEYVNVVWENNESVQKLKELASGKPLEIKMRMYGGFEQVGSIGQSLPRNDVQTVTNAGDIVLYSGNQIVIFYGSNSWTYTRLGHISDKTAAQLTALLSNGDVIVTIDAD